MGRNRFTDPRTADFYDWDINHKEEEEFGKERQVTYGANTANTGLIKQQGDASPLKIQVRGTVLQKSQHDEFIAWWKLCGDPDPQTIYFKDFADEEYEVIITAYKPTRKGVAANPRGGTAAPLWYWEYTMTMEVITIRSGSWLGVAP